MMQLSQKVSPSSKFQRELRAPSSFVGGFLWLLFSKKNIEKTPLLALGMFDCVSQDSKCLLRTNTEGASLHIKENVLN